MYSINDVAVRAKGVKTEEFFKVRRIVNEKKNYIKFKRMFDVVMSIMLIVSLAPLLLLIALLIKIDSPGDIFFMHRRAGYNGNDFFMIKFRTMKDGSEVQLKNQFKNKIENEGYHPKPKNDPRITKIGRLLRRTSLDELPQLFNVLFGDMSLVGPRPVMDYMRKPHMNVQIIREQVKPGITGLWQIKDRENGFMINGMVKYDMEYIEKLSFYQDLKIIFLTIPAIIIGKGAH